MGKLDVLTKLPQSDYKEIAPDINSDEFVKVVESRRSVRVYTDEKIPEEIVKKCLDLTLLAPNSSNLQPWEFYWVRSEDKKKELAKYCLGQLAATTAQELIVCVARTDKWKTRRNEMLKSFDESGERVPRGAYVYYKKIVPAAYTQGFFSIIGYIKKCIFFFMGFSKVTPREPTSYSDMRVWAHKSTALACENLMLSFRAFGYDSCPMEGLDSTRVKKLLNLPRKAEICMVVSAGKRSDKGVFGPRVRMESEKFVFEV
jgi:nitroreductase